MTSSTTLSWTTISISTFGSRLTAYSLPRYTAVWPFWRPWPRTSVTVIPARFSFSSASRTSSTLFGRTIHLMSFIPCLQHTFEFPFKRALIRLRQLASPLHDVQHVDRPLALGGNQHELDVTPLARDHPADAVEQSRRVVRDDLEHRELARVLVVEMHQRGIVPTAAVEDAAHLAGE